MNGMGQTAGRIVDYLKFYRRKTSTDQGCLHLLHSFATTLQVLCFVTQLSAVDGLVGLIAGSGILDRNGKLPSWIQAASDGGEKNHLEERAEWRKIPFCVGLFLEFAR